MTANSSPALLISEKFTRNFLRPFPTRYHAVGAAKSGNDQSGAGTADLA